MSHDRPAPGRVVALGTARTIALHEELLTQPLLAELTPVTMAELLHIFKHSRAYVRLMTACQVLQLALHT